MTAANSNVIAGSGSLSTFTSVDTIAEFKSVTSNLAAEYRRGGYESSVSFYGETLGDTIVSGVLAGVEKLER